MSQEDRWWTSFVSCPLFNNIACSQTSTFNWVPTVSLLLTVKMAKLCSKIKVVISRVQVRHQVWPMRWHSAAQQQEMANISPHKTVNTH